MGKLKWDHIQQLLSLPSVKKQWIAIYGQLPQEKEVEELYQQFEHYLFKDGQAFYLETRHIGNDRTVEKRWDQYWFHEWI